MFLRVLLPTEQHQRAAQESRGLQQELEEERARYQSLVQDYARLEQGYENLRDEVAFHRVRSCGGLSPFGLLCLCHPQAYPCTPTGDGV